MSSEKTEEPTPQKLNAARKRGEIARSNDVLSTAGFLVQLGIFSALGGFFYERLREMIVVTLQLAAAPWDANTLVRVAEYYFVQLLLLSGPPLILGALAAALAGAFVSGWLISFYPLTPQFDKLNPAAGLKRVFALRNVIDLLKMLVKASLVTVVLVMVLRDALRPIVYAPRLELDALVMMSRDVLTTIGAWSAAIFVVLAALDYAHQRYEFMKQNRMTKDEVKREYKDNEGDPLLKGKREELFREMAFNNALDNVRQSSVVVVNPTHVAVALRYEEGVTPLPLIVAKGVDDQALRIREIAEQANIPILRNVPLARDLNELCKTNTYVVDELLEPVAEVLRWVKRLHDQRKYEG
jgi:type III secretion protein U